MLKKYSTLMLIGLIINLAFSSFVFAQNTKNAEAEKIKIKVRKYGTKDKLTEVKLADNTKIRGYITEIKDDHFEFLVKKDRVSREVSFDKVKSVGRTFTTAQKVAAVTGGVIGALFLLAGICYATNSCTE